MTKRVETTADADIRACIDEPQSFALIAGAGSGKTSSLVDALMRVRDRHARMLRQNGQRVACITYTKRAVAVIKSRLGFDELYHVSTMHSFLWDQLSRFHSDIREALVLDRVPGLIAKAKSKDNGGNSKEARKARATVERLEYELTQLPTVAAFEYGDAKFSDYLAGQLSHDDVIEVATYLFAQNSTFRRITGLRFPYIFVDEAQDTFPGIVAGLNLVCEGKGLPIVGYFGDPWQQIYDEGIGSFEPPANSKVITKTENFRCSESVIRLLNAYRRDVKQYAAGENKGREGSVEFLLVQAEDPQAPRKRYSEEQIDRALARMDAALVTWGWEKRDDVMRLFLARQMIARRMGFPDLNRLFTGPYASSRAQDDFQAGEHSLLRHLTRTIWPLVAAHGGGDSRGVIEILRRDSPAFDPDGANAANTLKTMIERSKTLAAELHVLWTTGTIGDCLRYCVDKRVILASDRLKEHLGRQPRAEPYDEEAYGADKGDWLADELFSMATAQIPPYASFISENSAYSTQHGIKGEEYPRILIVYDDVEAAWHDYNFTKMFTPATAGSEPTEGQSERGRKLAYVSFSRALDDLRVLFFSANPVAARDELIGSNLLQPEQIRILA